MPFVAQTNPDNFVQGDTWHFHLSLDFGIQGILQTTVVVFRAMDRPLAAQSTEMLWKFLILILVEFGIRWGLVADEGSSADQGSEESPQLSHEHDPEADEPFLFKGVDECSPFDGLDEMMVEVEVEDEPAVDEKLDEVYPWRRQDNKRYRTG